MYLPEFKTIGLSEIFCIISAVAFVLILINYLINYLPLAKLKNTHLETETTNEPISVIICAKNEDDNLTEFLPKILTQNYLNFEVIVVNDCSNDNTEHVIDEYAKIFSNLRKANIKEDSYYKHGKKFAMLVGIKAATHNRLVFIDADCYPTGNNWLSQMAEGFTVNKQIVLGYGAYEKQPGLLNKLIRFDTFCIAANYISAAIKNKPYMGVGRNLAYTKDLFFKQNGFKSHYHINSGDDDLFVNEAANSTNTNICVDVLSITVSKPKKSFRDWRIQKSRHLTTSPYYKSQTKTKLFFNYFSQYFFYFSLIPLGFSFNTVLVIPAILLLKMLVQWLILSKITKRLNEPDLLVGSVIYELLLLIIYPIFHLSKLFFKQNKWTN